MAWNGLLPPTTAVERSRLLPTSWAMTSGRNTGQVLRLLQIECHDATPIGLSFWNGFGIGTPGASGGG